MTNVIVWDIETIPILNKAPIQQKKFQDKVDVKIGKLLETVDRKYVEDLVSATNPFFGQVLVISAYEMSERYPAGKTTNLIPTTYIDKLGMPSGIDEKELLNMWWSYISGFTGSFVGFNNLDFDAYFTIIRSMYHNIKPTNKNFLNLKRFSSWPHYDLMQQLGNWKFENKPTLEQTSEFFNIPSPKTGEVKAENVYSAFKEGRINEISKYCGEDVRATYEIFKIAKEYLPY